MKVKAKKLSLIALSLFTAISMFFGIKGFIPNSTMAESDATPVTEVFYDFEDGDAHSSEGYRTMKTMEISKEVVNEDGSTSTVTNTVLTNTTGWAGVYFHEIPMENLGKNWEISLDVHLADATAGIGEFRLGFYSTPNPGTNNGYDSSAVKSYFTATSFTTTKVLTTYEEGVIRSANAGEVVENRITYRYRDGRMYMNIAPWGSTNIEEEGVWQQVSGRIDLVGKTGYFTLQLGSNVGLDYIDNLSIKAIEGDGDAAFVDGSTPIWGTFKKNYYTDENGNEILNGEVYLTATEDYHIMYYKEKLPETFFISFDITDGSTRTDSYRIGIGCGTNADGSPVKETTYSTTAGVTLHHEYYYSAGMLDSYRSDGTRSTTTSTTITEATPYFSVRLTKGIKLENMVIDFNAMEDDTNVSAINNSISGKEYWLNGKTRRWDGTSGAYVWDDQTWVRHFDGERIKYELKYAGDRYERSILSDHYTEGDDENNYYRIDDSKDLQFSFDLGFAANTDIDVNTGTDARIALFMKNTDNAMSVDSGVYLLVTSWTKKVNGWVVYFNVTFGNTQTSEATSTSVFTTDPYLDVEFIYEADSCAMSVIVEDVNVINRRAIDITTGQGEANANGLILDRRYIGFLLKNRDLSLSNIEIKEGDEVVIDESNAGVAEKFTAITGKFQDVITPGNKVLAQVKGGYSVALSNDMLPKNYKVSMDLYTSVMRSLDDPSSQTSANSDQARIILMTNYVSGEGMESKGFAVTFGASMYRYARNLGTTGAGFNTTQLTKFYGDGNVYHLEFVYINGVMEFYVDGKLAVSEGYTVNRDGDYVCFQFNNESTYIGNYEVEDLTYDINFGIDNEELGTVKINDVDAVSGEIAVLKGEAVKLTATANANAIIKAVFVNDSEILVTSTTDFEAVVLDAIEANAEIVVRFAERDSLALGESVVYDAMTSTQSNDWKENVYDYSGLKVVRYNDYNGTTENPNYTFNLGPGVAGGKGYITYKISLNDLSAEAGQSVAGIVIATRAKLSVFDEKVRQQCYIDFYVGYEDPIVNGYDGFTYAGKVEPKAGQVNAATYNASNKTILSIDNTQEYVYVQVRMGTADSNWITLRELGFSSCSYQINDSFTAKYDDATDSSYTGWMNGLYDYSNITVKGFDGLFAIAPNGPTGYITYKIDASNIENLDKIIIDARAKLTNWSGAPNANYYINYYVGYADPAANGYDSFALVYEAPVMYNGQDGFNQTQLTNKAYTFEIQPEQSFVYLQIRIGGNSGNWICLRETSIRFAQKVDASKTFNKIFDDDSCTTVAQAINGAYDWNNIRIIEFDKMHALGNSADGVEGYITYKFVAPEGKTFESAIIDLRGKLSKFFGSDDTCYIHYYIGLEDPFVNGYTNFKFASAVPIGEGNNDYNNIEQAIITGDIVGQTEFYIQIRIQSQLSGWIGIRELNINALYPAAKVTINYGSSYSVENRVEFDTTIDSSILNIKDGFMAVDGKLYTDVACTEEFNFDTVISEDIILYVKVMNGYITYELDGGVNAPENKAYYEAAAGLVLGDPIKEGFDFVGWYLDADLTIPFTGITAQTTGDLELFAAYEEIPDVSVTGPATFNYNESAGTTDWQNGAYDFSGLKMRAHDGVESLGIEANTGSGYITYKIDVSSIENFGLILVNARGKLTNYGNAALADKAYIKYYIGYEEPIAHGYDNFVQIYEAPVENAEAWVTNQAAAGDKAYSFAIKPEQDVVYLQIRIGSPSEAWICLRETSFSFNSYVNTDEGKTTVYDGTTQTTLEQAIANAYDYSKIEVREAKSFFTANATNGTGYITYKFVAPEGKTFASAAADMIASLPTYVTAAGTEKGREAYVEFKVGFVDPVLNGYDSFEQVYHQAAMDSNPTAYADSFNIDLTGKTEFYLQAIVRVYDRNWVGIKSISITPTYHTSNVTINYGSSYSETKKVDFNAKIDESILNIKDGFIALDGKFYTDVACTNVFDINTPITEDINLYVKVANGYIFYNLGGGVNAPENKNYYLASEGLTLGKPTKENAMFLGWYLDADLTIEFTGITAETTGDITLYAKYRETPQITNVFAAVYDKVTSVDSTEWMNGVYDYDNIRIYNHDVTEADPVGLFSLGTGKSGYSTGYLTYKINVSDVENVEKILIGARGKLTNWTEGATGETDNLYVHYYVGYVDPIVNGYDSYELAYRAPVNYGSVNGQSNKAYSFALEPVEDVIYLQIRIASNGNWICIKETSISFAQSIDMTNGLNYVYDNKDNSLALLDVIGNVYDYEGVKLYNSTANDAFRHLGPSQSKKYGYITYKLVAPEGRVFESLNVYLRGKLPLFSGTIANSYVHFYVGYEDGKDNAYANYNKIYEATVEGQNNSYDHKENAQFVNGVSGQTVIYLQIRVSTDTAGWLGLRELKIDATYNTVQVQVNYGSSYTEYYYEQFNGDKLDLSIINIRDNFIRLDNNIYTDANFTNIFDVNSIIDGDTVLYVRVANGYINYNLNGGTNGAENKGYYESANGAITLADPVKKGYIFSGWYTDSDCTILFTNIEQGRFGDITLYAKWTQEVAIKIAYFDVVGGSLEGFEFDEVSGNYYKLFFTNVGIDSLPTPTKANAVFIGWYIGEYQYNSIFAGTLDNVTLTAKWAEIDEPALEPDVSTGDFVDAKVTIGADLTLTYNATVENGESVAMLVTMNGKQVVVSAQEVGDNSYDLAFNNIAPHMMGANITTQLIVNNVVKDVIGEYSVAENLINTFNRTDIEELKTLVADTLNYGAMAQAYKNHDLDNLVNGNPEIMAYATNFEAVTESDYSNQKNNAVEGFKIGAAGVYFDYVNYVYIKFLAGDNFKVTVAAEGLEETEIKNIKQEGGYYVAFSPEVSALYFDKVYTFKLYSGETLVQTVDYSVKTFVYNKQGGDTLEANLAKALYNYGIASVNYKKVK